MTEIEFENRVAALEKAEFEAASRDELFKDCDQQTVQKMLAARIDDRIYIEVENDAEFKQAYQAWLDEAIAQALLKLRPVGAYREDGVLVIGDDLRVLMPGATRDHLLAWATYEEDGRNLAYIKSRLDLFNAHPECKTLGELETNE